MERFSDPLPIGARSPPSIAVPTPHRKRPRAGQARALMQRREPTALHPAP
jgi:hypothetical protein